MPSLKRIALALVAATLGATALGCSGSPPPPPAAPHEVRPARPIASARWVPGHWKWLRGQERHVWVPGHWATH
jgi:hypothetical protein